MKTLFNYILLAVLLAFTSACQEDILTGEDPIVPSEEVGVEALGIEGDKSSGSSAFLLFHKGGSNNYIYTMRTRGAYTSGMQNLYRLPKGFRTNETPVSVAYGKEVFLYWKSATSDDIWVSKTSCDDAIGSGSNWVSASKALDLPHANKNVGTPEVVVYNNMFYMFYSYNGRIQFVTSMDGINFGSIQEISSYRNSHGAQINTGIGFNKGDDVKTYKMAASVNRGKLYLFFVGEDYKIQYLVTGARVANTTDWQSFERFTPSNVKESTRSGIDVVTLPSSDMVLTFTGYSSKRVLVKTLTVDPNTIFGQNDELILGSTRHHENKYSQNHIGIAADLYGRNVMYSFKSRNESWSGPVESMLGTTSFNGPAPTSYTSVSAIGSTRDAGVSLVYVQGN